jgi:hypothetical protein
MSNYRPYSRFSLLLLLLFFLSAMPELLAYESENLRIWGYREFELSDYNYKGDFNHFLQRNPQVMTDSRFEQRTRINVSGELGDNVSIDAVFDDSNFHDEDEKILINIRGRDFEAALGRISLQLDSTKYVLNNKKAMGIFIKKRTGRLESSFLVSRSEGQEEKERFTGQGLQREYILSKSPVVFGSERIFLDGRELISGKDYRLDYEGGSIELEAALLPIEANSVLIVEYESARDGSMFKNRILGTRQSWRFDERGYFGASYVLSKDQVSQEILEFQQVKPQSLGVLGFDGRYNFAGGLELGFEFAHSSKDPDLAGGTLAPFSGNAFDLSLKGQRGRNTIIGSKERIEPEFRSIGRSGFVQQGRDSDFVGDIDQNSLGYQYATTNFSAHYKFRESKTNLSSDPALDTREFMSSGFDLSGKLRRNISLRASLQNENTPVYRNGILTEYNILRRRGGGLTSPFFSGLEFSWDRDNEGREKVGDWRNLIQTDNYQLSSSGSESYNWNIGSTIRSVTDIYMGTESEESSNHFARFNYRQGRVIQSQLEYVWRKDEFLTKDEELKTSSAGADFSYRPNRDFEYSFKLKQEVKRRVILETARTDWSLIRDPNRKEYITPVNPVQTFMNSQQLRFRQKGGLSHRFSFREREEKEKNGAGVLNSDETSSYDLRWDVWDSLRLRYAWNRRERYNKAALTDRLNIDRNYELSHDLKKRLTLIAQYDSEYEDDYIDKNFLDRDSYNLRVEKMIDTQWRLSWDLKYEERDGREKREDRIFGSGVVYTPENSDLRLSLNASGGRARNLLTDDASSVEKLELNVNKRILKDAHLEGGYKFEREGPSFEGDGYTGSLYRVKVTMDF